MDPEASNQAQQYIVKKPRRQLDWVDGRMVAVDMELVEYWWSGSCQMSKTSEQTRRKFFDTPMRFWFKFCTTHQTDGHRNQESKTHMEEPHQAQVDTWYLGKTFHKQCHKHLTVKSSVSEFGWLIVVDTPEMSENQMPVGSGVMWNMAENGLLDRHGVNRVRLYIDTRVRICT